MRYRTAGHVTMGLYFRGRIISDQNVDKRLAMDELKGVDIGKRIWVWTNEKTGETIITGDEGNGYCVILTKSKNKEEAIMKLKIKKAQNEIFTERMQRILKESHSITD